MCSAFPVSVLMMVISSWAQFSQVDPLIDMIDAPAFALAIYALRLAVTKLEIVHS